jgi:citrate lyase subunit beta/citryl-CoA lyase
LISPEAPIRSYLYVPASEPRMISKALASEADAVMLDLEDAVAPNRKTVAREEAARVLREDRSKPVFVRINRMGSEFARRDIEAVASPHLDGLRLPKTESSDEVLQAVELLEGLGCTAGLQCLIESALGLERAFEIAVSHERVIGLGMGEADLSADLGVRGEEGLMYARSRVIAAARAARLVSPSQSVYTDVRDLEGLKDSSEKGKALGFIGRSAIHPDQIPVINETFAPTEEEVAEARELISRMEGAEETGTGAFALEDGRFVDRAVVESARLTLSLARRHRKGE